MTRRELLGAFGISLVAWSAVAVAARDQETKKGPAKTASVILAISGMT
jgi:hypothetical protein